jgi:CRP/FNR family transcriptional regulator, dissimilatory nitrate respiration regulator
MNAQKGANETPLHWLPQALKNSVKVRDLADGEYLFRQGDSAVAIYEIERGRLAMVRYTTDSRAVIVHSARQGQLFAEASLFAQTYHCDAIAAGVTRVRVYPKERLVAAFSADPQLALSFTAVLAHEIMALRARLEVRNVRSARERILQHLGLIADAPHVFRLDSTLKDLAAEIGLTHEAFYRALAALEKDGEIERKDDRIVLRSSNLYVPLK